MTTRLTFFSPKIFILLFVVSFLIIGGNEFSPVITKHWTSAHPEALTAKEKCLEKSQDWRLEKTSRGDAAFCYDEESGYWLVIIFSIVGSAVVLITGYFIAGRKTPDDWLKRQSNRR